jgi:hypothetical protein
MKTVVLVGAGATLAEAKPSYPPRVRTPPLDTTFFDLCRLARLEGRATVKRYMLRQYGLDPFDGFRMEEIFNYVYSDAFAASDNTDSLGAYWALLQMYRNAIARTTNPLNGTSRFGVGALLRFLWRIDPTREITFVTFNQDLVIEKALNAAIGTSRYSAIPWNIRAAYVLEFMSIVLGANRPRPFRSNGADSVRILKLHGSLNWVYPVRSGTDPRNSIRNPTTALRCFGEPDIHTGRIDLGRSEERGRANELISLVVPPVYEKASRYQAVLKPVWDAARTVLEEADELVIFGYSFPDVDFSARSMLRQAYHKNATLKDVHVIDTDPNVSAKIAEFLDASSVYFCRTVPDFIEHYE